jgi:negative regulator of flagellin synthesis FlgM
MRIYKTVLFFYEGKDATLARTERNLMNINHINRIGPVNPYRKQVETGKTGAAGKPGAKKDGVEFSDEALKLLESRPQAADAARLERIAELKEAVSTGTYRVEAGKVAEKLLPHLLDGEPGQ